MAETEKLALDAQQIIAAKIRQRLESPSQHEALMGIAEGLDAASAEIPLVELGETLSVYNLLIEDVERFEQSGGDLRLLARPTGRMHHQVKVAGRATRFAQTKMLGQDVENWPLCELFASPLAERIHTAIDLADEQVSDDKIARLLLAPAFHVVALWFCEKDDVESQSAADTQVLVITAPDEPEFMTGQIISGNAFMRALVNSAPISGFSVE